MHINQLFYFDRKRLKRLLTFFILIFGASAAMKLSSMKDAFYFPMLHTFHITNEQLGATRSIYGVVQMLGYIPAMFIADRFSKKIMIPFSLLCLALIGLYFATIPSYIGLLVVFGSLAIFGEMTYWPIMLKSVRLLGSADEQGRLFGFLEGGRGLIDIILSFASLWIFTFFANEKAGFQHVIHFDCIVLILTAIASYWVLEHDRIDNAEGVIASSKRILLGIKGELHKKELWLLAFTVFFIWVTYAGLTSFIPYMRNIFSLPIVLVGVYGIINQYGLKLVGGPVAGILADKYFKSPLKTMRVAFIGGIMGLILIIVYSRLGHSTGYTIAIILTLVMASFIFMLRALAFSPMAELKIPKSSVGSALSLVCMIGYSANIFAYAMYGKIIDIYPGTKGYDYVFMIMIICLILAYILSSLTFKIVHNKNGSVNIE
ncbi:MAG: MFS transporter [Coxiella sp. (in: Bacteria)]|nr:MAG: MFS transporter [Coxiella sp. (in: g-proteobacteria)]